MISSPYSSYADEWDTNFEINQANISLSGSVRGQVAQNAPAGAVVNANKVGPYGWKSQKLSTVDFSSIPFIPAVTFFPKCNPSTFQVSDTIELNYVPDVNDNGDIYLGTTTNRYTGVALSNKFYCKAPSTPTSTIPQGIPKPPTYSQVWLAIYDQNFSAISRNNAAYISPATPGLTGLPSKFWAKFPDGQSIYRNVTLPNGFSVESTARITSVEILLKTPKGKVTTLKTITPDASGVIPESTYLNPAASFTFKSSGSYVITTGIIWTAQAAVVSGPGLPTITVPHGSLRVELNYPYQVNQIRAGLTQ